MFFFGKKKKEKEKSTTNNKIKKEFDISYIDDVIDYIKKFSGVNLEPKRDIIKTRLVMFSESKEIYSFLELLNKIKIDKQLSQELINLVTVNETYFYRELSQLNDSVSYIKELNKKVRILCAPCASGEEVYSLGIMALEMGLNKNDIDLIGVDINSKAIECSKVALYSQRSLHRLTPELISKYFQKIDEKYKIKQDKLPHMRFEVLNIFDDKFLDLGQFDIIFSRNMMIYFDEYFKEKTVKRFHELLKNNGRFYSGHADLVPETDLFKKIIKGRLNYYQKS